MKTIIKSIIAILICGFVLMGLTNSTTLNNVILLQSVDKTVSSVSLTRSAEIISKRLAAYGPEKFDVTIIPEMHQIKVTLGENSDLNAVEKLLIQKGKLEFYATYNHQRLSELLKGDDQLFSLLNAKEASKTYTRVGCTDTPDREKINDYLKTTGLNEKCRFAWSQSPNTSEACLYALELGNQQGASYTRADIASAQFYRDKSSKLNAINLKFKDQAIASWADFTKRNIDNAIAIVLDDNVICAPIVRSAIEKGNCMITGDFTEVQVRHMAIVIHNGELPVSFKVVQ